MSFSFRILSSYKRPTLTICLVLLVDLLPSNWTVRIENILVMSLAGNARTIDEDEQM
jgi:hypothetical protein